MSPIQRVRVLGVPVDTVDIQTALDRVNEFLHNGKKGCYILAINPEKVITLQKNRFLKRMFEQAALLIPDGIGVVHAVKFLYKLGIKRVAGADLMSRLCSQAQEHGYRVFVYGATEEVNRGSVERLKALFPGLQVAGRSNGFVSEEKMDVLVAQINRAKPDILFIALGSPKQEMWIQEHLPRLNVKVCQGVGGTLDILSGRKKRAPRIFLKLGFEFLFRLACEPARIRRQIVFPLFTVKVLFQKLKDIS